MSVSGDFMRLALLKDRLRQIANGGASKEVLGALRDTTNGLVIDCFNQKRDPYGRTWQPRKPPPLWAVKAFGLVQDNHPLLDKTGALIDSVRTVALKSSIKVNMRGYGVYHWQPDRPGEQLPQRAMLPTARQGLGPVWSDAYLKTAREVSHRYLGRL